MGKKEKPKFLDYLNAVKKADREREIAQHGKLISTRPLRIVKSKKVYDRKRDKRDCSNYNDGSLFFYSPTFCITISPSLIGNRTFTTRGSACTVSLNN